MTGQVAVIEAAEIMRASAVVGALTGRDVAALSEHDFLAAYRAAAHLGRLADALESQFAGDAARRSTPDLPGGGLARRQGFGNAASMVAAVTGGSQAGAWRAIEAGKAFTTEPTLPNDPSDPSGVADDQPPDAPTPPTPLAPRYPVIAAASVAGDLSRDAAALIMAGLEQLTDRVPSDQLHDLEQRLVAKAVHLNVRDVRRLVADAVARADLAGHEARERRHHADRYLSWSEDHTGMVTLSARLDAVTAAPIRTVIEQMVTHQFRQRRNQDPLEQDQRTPGQLRADALHHLARHALGCKETTSSGIRTTIVVRMTLSDMQTGSGLGSIDGTTQPVSVGELRRLAGDAGVIPHVLGGDSETLDMGRTVRMFTTAQRFALIERDGGCAKCHAPPQHCEAHHIQWWDHGGRTDLNNGVMLCTRCHHDIHRQHWGIHIRHGHVHFTPPPTIDPTQTPQLGGLAALTLNGSRNANSGNTDPPGNHPGENSVQNATPCEDTA
jgi:hypothetical protein